MPSTRERVIALIKQSPHLNQTEIAEKVGATRQRVSQIIASEGLNVPKGKRGVGARAKPAGVAEMEATSSSEAIPAYLAEAGGLAAVLVTAADLTTRGFSVYLPVNPSAAADLVAIDSNGNVKRIDVKNVRRRPGQKLEYEYPKPGDVDVRALVLTDEPVQYSPKL